MIYTWIVATIIILVIIWLIFGRKQLEFKGLDLGFNGGTSIEDGEVEYEDQDFEREVDELEQDLYDVSVSEGYQDHRANINSNSQDILADMNRLIDELSSITFEETVEDLRMHPWAHERHLCKLLTTIYGKKFIKVRPKFLRNPDTGRLLELDCFNEELKLAAEYSGIQHFQHPNFTGQTYEEFVSQLRRDRYKKELCEKQGIYLIIVPHTVNIKNMARFLVPLLPEYRQQ